MNTGGIKNKADQQKRLIYNNLCLKILSPSKHKIIINNANELILMIKKSRANSHKLPAVFIGELGIEDLELDNTTLKILRDSDLFNSDVDRFSGKHYINKEMSEIFNKEIFNPGLFSVHNSEQKMKDICQGLFDDLTKLTENDLIDEQSSQHLFSANILNGDVGTSSLPEANHDITMEIQLEIDESTPLIGSQTTNQALTESFFRRAINLCCNRQFITRHHVLFSGVCFRFIKDFTVAALMRSDALGKREDMLKNNVTPIAVGAMFVVFLAKLMADSAKNFSQDRPNVLKRGAQDIVNITAITTTAFPTWCELITGTPIDELTLSRGVETLTKFFETAAVKSLPPPIIGMIGSKVIELCSTRQATCSKNETIKSILILMQKILTNVLLNVGWFYLYALSADEELTPAETGTLIAISMLIANSIGAVLETQFGHYIDHKLGTSQVSGNSENISTPSNLPIQN